MRKRGSEGQIRHYFRDKSDRIEANQGLWDVEQDKLQTIYQSIGFAQKVAAQIADSV